MQRTLLPCLLPLVLAAAGLLAAGCGATGRVASDAAQAAGNGSNGTNGKDDIKPYSEVVTGEAETDEGLFTVHRVDEQLLYEIPDSLLGTELLLVSRIARTADDIGYGGEKANTQVVRWDRQGDRVLLRIVSYENVASEDKPIYEAVRNANFEPIVAAFPIAAYNDDTTAVVLDVTSLFTDDVPVLGLQKSRREAFKVRRLDKERSYVTSAKSYPQNVEVRHVLTYEAAEPPSNGSTNAISLEMNQSMIQLPADPMTPRPCDDRVGYFSVEQVDYGADAQRAEERCFITRWRLEPSDMEAFQRGELVEPVKPIVYYIDPATPMKWRPYIKQGVDDWQKAFEAAGFKNAILAKDPPSPEEDPEFSPEDIRYSVIRYFPSDVENAYGPHVHDPRTGEILESDIGWFHNVMNLLRNWFLVQTAASNPEARSPEFKDEVMGELIRFVSAHEVGHTIGLPHNWGSSAAYPVDSLRSPSFTMLHGTAPSIMDYARFNYVAQPEDGLTDLQQFLPAIGEYDVWSVEWGYKPIPEATTAQAQKPILNAWIREHEDDPRYFYGRQTFSQIDPRSQREDLGDDAIEASELGLRNLKRIVPSLIEWSYREGEDYDDLEELFGRVIGQYNLYLGHVTRQIGGVYETPRTYDQEGEVYAFVPEETQRRAMTFLQEHAFAKPEWMLEQDVLRRIEHAGALDRIRRTQVAALDLLLDPQRLARMIEAEAVLDDTYTPTEMLDDLRQGLWSELGAGGAVNVYRRNLQRAYLEKMHELMTEDPSPPPAQFAQFFGFTPVDVTQSDIPALVRGELEVLRGEAQRAVARTDDRATRLHLQDTIARIERILDPES